jgi:NAD-dependent deacetylase
VVAHETEIREVAAALREASVVTVLTGSGISAESGVPTFREAQSGLWSRYDPQELATPEAFEQDPCLVWNWYEWRRSLISEAVPNAAHAALAALERRVPSFRLLTQNVDGLHQRAGSEAVVELHGNITRSRCSREGDLREPPDVPGEVPPRRPQCGAYLRPDVVWFGEALAAAAIDKTSDTARACDVFISVGTSSLVYPAAALPFEALEAGATVVEVNPAATPLTSSVHHALSGTAGEVLPALVRQAG